MPKKLPTRRKRPRPAITEQSDAARRSRRLK